MVYFQIISLGTPIYPITIGINAPINVSQTLVNSITIEAAEGTPEFEAKCIEVVQNAENAYKQLPEFSVQDTSRNGQYTIIPKGGLLYDIEMSWTIQNAEISLQATTQTDLEGQSRQDILQILADTKVADFKAQWQWIDL